jgi:hypothetical protein
MCVEVVAFSPDGKLLVEGLGYHRRGHRRTIAGR